MGDQLHLFQFLCIGQARGGHLLLGLKRQPVFEFELRFPCVSGRFLFCHLAGPLRTLACFFGFVGPLLFKRLLEPASLFSLLGFELPSSFCEPHCFGLSGRFGFLFAFGLFCSQAQPLRRGGLRCLVGLACLQCPVRFLGALALLGVPGRPRYALSLLSSFGFGGTGLFPCLSGKTRPFRSFGLAGCGLLLFQCFLDPASLFSPLGFQPLSGLCEPHCVGSSGCFGFLFAFGLLCSKSQLFGRSGFRSLFGFRGLQCQARVLGALAFLYLSGRARDALLFKLSGSLGFGSPRHSPFLFGKA